MEKVRDLLATFKKISTASEENLHPYMLDSQSSFVPVCNNIKDCLKELTYYANDFHNRNFMGKAMQAKKIKAKVNHHLGSLVAFVRLSESLSYNHNQIMLT